MVFIFLMYRKFVYDVFTDSSNSEVETDSTKMDKSLSDDEWEEDEEDDEEEDESEMEVDA